jgi:hypothetical protein
VTGNIVDGNCGVVTQDVYTDRLFGSAGPRCKEVESAGPPSEQRFVLLRDEGDHACSRGNRRSQAQVGNPARGLDMRYMAHTERIPKCVDVWCRGISQCPMLWRFSGGADDGFRMAVDPPATPWNNPCPADENYVELPWQPSSPLIAWQKERGKGTGFVLAGLVLLSWEALATELDASVSSTSHARTRLSCDITDSAHLSISPCRVLTHENPHLDSQARTVL